MMMKRSSPLFSTSASAQLLPNLNIRLRHHLFAAVVVLLFCESPIRSVHSRGVPINLYEQPGNWHRGPGDIANLWAGFTPEGGFRPPGPITRNAIKPNSQNRWTRYQNDRGQFIIPYIVSGKFDSQEHAIIARAMLAIAENTCIKFEKRGGEADYVDLKNERGEGCYTVVGRAPGKNTVMLETNEIATCLEFDIVIHELMHTIGLWHEQMRYDRDEFIKIHWENIGPAYVTQFEKVPDTDSTTYGVRYDYQSVMHYAKDAFASAPGKITMETLDKQFQDVIGRVKDASASDYLKICNIYACHTCMGHPFEPGQSRPADGQRVVTLGPGPVTLPTASPSPATLPLRPPTTPWSVGNNVGSTTTIGPPTRTPPRPTSTTPTPRDSQEKEERRVRPTPLLPIILPLINNNWWWKNTPAPPLRDPHGRKLLLMARRLRDDVVEKVDVEAEEIGMRNVTSTLPEEEEQKSRRKRPAVQSEAAEVAVAELAKSAQTADEAAEMAEVEQELERLKAAGRRRQLEVLAALEERKRMSKKAGGKIVAVGPKGTEEKQKLGEKETEEEEEESAEWREVPEAEEEESSAAEEEKKPPVEEKKPAAVGDKISIVGQVQGTVGQIVVGQGGGNAEKIEVEEESEEEEDQLKELEVLKVKLPVEEKKEPEKEEVEEEKPKKRRRRPKEGKEVEVEKKPEEEAKEEKKPGEEKPKEEMPNEEMPKKEVPMEEKKPAEANPKEAEEEKSKPEDEKAEEEEENKQRPRAEKSAEVEGEEPRPKKPPKCRDAAFCLRLFRRPQHLVTKSPAALKACALGVIKHHCCASCRGHGRKVEQKMGEEEANNDAEATAKKRRKEKRKRRKQKKMKMKKQKQEEQQRKRAKEARVGEEDQAVDLPMPTKAD